MDVLFFLFVSVILLFLIFAIRGIDAKNSEQRRQERRKHRERELEQRIQELKDSSSLNQRKDGKTGFYGNTDFSDNYYGILKGKYAEKLVSDLLEKLIKNNGAHLICNVRLPLYESTCEIDHLVIGKFGVLVIETKGQSGEISGEGKQLIQNIGPYTYTLYNPQYQNKTHTDNVAYHLRKGKLGNVPVYGVVVFTAEDVIFPDGLGIRLEELPDYYYSLRNCNCNTEKIFDYFKRICVSCSYVI